MKKLTPMSLRGTGIAILVLGGLGLWYLAHSLIVPQVTFISVGDSDYLELPTVEWMTNQQYLQTIVHGTVIGIERDKFQAHQKNEVFPLGKIPYADVTITIIDYWARPLPYPEIIVRTPGGTVDGLTYSFGSSPNFNLGEEVILFLFKASEFELAANEYTAGDFAVFHIADGKAKNRWGEYDVQEFKVLITELTKNLPASTPLPPTPYPPGYVPATGTPSSAPTWTPTLPSPPTPDVPNAYPILPSIPTSDFPKAYP